jgi:DNA-binding NarL/FixJ family response regulator
MSRGNREFSLQKPRTSLVASPRLKHRLFPQPVCELRERDAGADMAAQRKGIRTIVVDDSPAALRAMSSVVARQQNLSFVGAASNGRDALALARSLHPDLVLLDLEMPVMDGIEATSCLGRDCPATQVVIVTVHNTPALRKLCYERGARGFIAKDTLKDELPTIVLKLFGNGE